MMSPPSITKSAPVTFPGAPAREQHDQIGDLLRLGEAAGRRRGGLLPSEHVGAFA